MKKVMLVLVILIASLSLVSTKEHKEEIASAKTDYMTLDFSDAGGPPTNGPVKP